MCLGLCKCAGHSRGDADPRQPRPPLGTGAAAGARVPPRVRRHRGCQLVCVALLRVFPPDRRHVAEDTPSCVAFLALLTSPDPVVKVLVSPIEPSVSCCAAFLVQWQCSHLVAPKYLAISDKCVHKKPSGSDKKCPRPLERKLTRTRRNAPARFCDRLWLKITSKIVFDFSVTSR